MINASSVRIPAQWLDGATVRREVAEFRLGPGPCGQTVTDLLVALNEGTVSVFQDHADGSTKVFIYPVAQLTGRVEIEGAK